jgi:hypothetical protein
MPSVGPQYVSTPNIPESLRVWAWLDPERLTSALLASIREDRDQETMPAHERTARVAELDREIDWLERSEEMGIRQAARMGLTIVRRANASPAAVLGTRIWPRERRVA